MKTCAVIGSTYLSSERLATAMVLACLTQEALALHP